MEDAVEDTRHGQDNVVGNVLKKLTAIVVQIVCIRRRLKVSAEKKQVY